MYVKKYLDYAGLQRYDDNWKLKFQEMIISDNEMEDMLLDELGIVSSLPETWTASADGTLDLSLSNAYSYWPEGAGTKTVSIANGTTSGLSKFFLKLTDAGNFPMQWGSNIQWKDGSEPEWQAFNEDVIYFKSTDGGNTWTGQVVQTSAITPYLKLTMQVPWKQYSERTDSYSEDAYFIRLNLTSLSDDTVIEWGDGSSTNVTNTSAYYVHEHEYAESGTYHIKVTSNNFHTAALLDWLGMEWLVSDWMPYTETLYSVDSPYPLISGIWRDISTSNHFEESFGGCFYNCKILTQIPDKLFHNNPQSISFSECFNGCSSITSIPSGLFDNNTAVTNFASCFRNCTSLQSIPAGLFDNNTAVTNFYFCFYGCTSLTSIPSGLFDKNIAVTDFYECFQNCSSLASIPEGLFDNNTAVTSFYYCFYGCTSLTSIPSGLFDNNVAATNFTGCFSLCSSLQSIPSGLFDKNVAVTSFSGCFRYCTSLNNFTLHIGSSLVTICSDFVTRKTDTTRTIYVPSGSTTQTTFNAIASSLGLTIVGV